MIRGTVGQQLRGIPRPKSYYTTSTPRVQTHVVDNPDDDGIRLEELRLLLPDFETPTQVHQIPPITERPSPWHNYGRPPLIIPTLKSPPPRPHTTPRPVPVQPNWTWSYGNDQGSFDNASSVPPPPRSRPRPQSRRPWIQRNPMPSHWPKSQTTIYPKWTSQAQRPTRPRHHGPEPRPHRSQSRPPWRQDRHQRW